MKLNDILTTAIHNFKNSADRLKLTSKIFDNLIYPKEKIECCINPIMSDGKHRNIKVFIVRHNDTLGPSKGGIRMTEAVTLDDINGLAMEMTWKTALIGVPFGGGKAGICCAPVAVNNDDKEIIIRSFTRGMIRHIGPETYVPAPDMGTNEIDMGHVKDCIAYSLGTSITKGCFVTGKPVILGGIAGRREATGNGVAYTIASACNKLGIEITKAKVVIQGYGNVGSVAAKTLSQMGASIIAVADLSGALYNPAGLDIERLSDYFSKTGILKGFDAARQMEPSEIFELPCDILVPAAAQSQITSANAAKIKAKIVAEGANAPTTPEADEILNQNGIFIIPDILCNAGGVFVSYLEYTQETQREQMTAESVQKRLVDRMQAKFKQVYNYANANKITMRQSAMDIAVKTVSDGLVYRGFHP